MFSPKPPVPSLSWPRQMPVSLLVAAFLIIALILPLSMLLPHNPQMGVTTHPATLLPGLTIAKDSSSNGSLVVTSIQSAGSDQRSTIAVGDRITKINGKPVFTVHDARTYLHRHPIHPIWLEVVHGTVHHIVQIT